MKYDLQLIPETSGEVLFSVRGKSPDTGLMLLQRLYVLLFTDHSAAYRDGDYGIDLCALTDGANEMDDAEMNTLLAMARTYAMSALSEEDAGLIADFDCACIDGDVTGTLVLTDGTTIEGTIRYA